MTCEWCREEQDRLYLTKCGLYLCCLCYEDHNRQPCPECAWEKGFEAADCDWDKERDT